MVATVRRCDGASYGATVRRCILACDGAMVRVPTIASSHVRLVASLRPCTVLRTLAPSHLMSLSLGTEITLDIEKPAAGGWMLGRHEGLVVLVRGAIPGERVRA